MNITHQSVFETWPMEDKSVQAIITSPPYWSLRKYDIPDCSVIGMQYGLEPTYQEYIEHTRLWVKEAWRVLRDDGVMFLNLGDSYCGGGRGSDNKFGEGREGQPLSWKGDDSIRQKCKLLIPHRVAIALIDDGWILRNDIVWFKPNAMPESCRDRFSKKTEYIFMLTKQPKYYFDLDGVREEHRRGKNPGDIWAYNTQPSPEKHYAMWPEKLVERMVMCSTKAGDTVLDPFAGSGTTLRVADQHNRHGEGIDLGYQDIQERRLSNIQKELL